MNTIFGNYNKVIIEAQGAWKLMVRAPTSEAPAVCPTAVVVQGLSEWRVGLKALME
jgi:hypothetical protein